MRSTIGIFATVIALACTGNSATVNNETYENDQSFAAVADSNFETNNLTLGLRNICYARNLRGETFSGRGLTRNAAQQRALRNCVAVSARCRVVRCD